MTPNFCLLPSLLKASYANLRAISWRVPSMILYLMIAPNSLAIFSRYYWGYLWRKRYSSNKLCNMQAYISCSFFTSDSLNFCMVSINSRIFWSTWAASAEKTFWKYSFAALSISSEFWIWETWLGKNSPILVTTSLIWSRVSSLILGLLLFC